MSLILLQARGPRYEAVFGLERTTSLGSPGKRRNGQTGLSGKNVARDALAMTTGVCSSAYSKAFQRGLTESVRYYPLGLAARAAAGEQACMWIELKQLDAGLWRFARSD